MPAADAVVDGEVGSVEDFSPGQHLPPPLPAWFTSISPFSASRCAADLRRYSIPEPVFVLCHRSRVEFTYDRFGCH